MSAIPPNIAAAMARAKHHRVDADDAELSGGSGPDPDAYQGLAPLSVPDVRMDRGRTGRPGGPWVTG